MQIIDTHCHIYTEQFNEDRNQMIKRAIDSGVVKMLLPNIDKESWQPMLNLCNEFPDNLHPMCGLHPCDVKDNFEAELSFFEQELKQNHKKHIGIGETGIDLYWDKSTLPQQEESLIRHIKWAVEYDLPLIIHARDSYNEIFKVIKDHYQQGLKGIFHCFSASKKEANFIMELETFLMGIGGVISYKKNNELRDVVSKIPNQFLVLETDAPYLPPVPYRGKRNEPSYLWYTLDVLSQVKNTSKAHLAEITTENTQKLFKL
jgi:TatD DNase family protein